MVLDALLQNYRRLCIRWEKSTAMFPGFINFSCLKRFWVKF